MAQHAKRCHSKSVWGLVPLWCARSGWICYLALGIIAGGSGACDDSTGAPPAVAYGDAVSAPTEDAFDDCSEMTGGLRVCWGDGGVHVQATTTPNLPPQSRWRCWGHAAERRCRLHPERPFRCHAGGTQCVQQAPRLPSDAVWECSDVRGVVVCRSRSDSAGVVAGPAEDGWICGEGPMPICVDLDPDLPALRDLPSNTSPDGHDEAVVWDCRYDHQPHFVRVCRRSSEIAARLHLPRGCRVPGWDDVCEYALRAAGRSRSQTAGPATIARENNPAWWLRVAEQTDWLPRSGPAQSPRPSSCQFPTPVSVRFSGGFAV